MNGMEIVSKLSEKYPIKYKNGKQLASFIDHLMKNLPSMYENYDDVKESYIFENIENILEIGK